MGPCVFSCGLCCTYGSRGGWIPIFVCKREDDVLLLIISSHVSRHLGHQSAPTVGIGTAQYCELTLSVHLNSPTKTRVSVVWMRSVLPRRASRYCSRGEVSIVKDDGDDALGSWPFSSGKRSPAPRGRICICTCRYVSDTGVQVLLQFVPMYCHTIQHSQIPTKGLKQWFHLLPNDIGNYKHAYVHDSVAPCQENTPCIMS